MFLKLSIVETQAERQGSTRPLLLRADSVLAVSMVTINAPDYAKLHGKVYSVVEYDSGMQTSSFTVEESIKIIETMLEEALSQVSRMKE